MISNRSVCVIILKLSVSICCAQNSEPISVGGDRQLFVDEYMIASMENVSLKLHEPIPREIIFYFDKPWEGSVSWGPNLFKDSDRYRMWYRGMGLDESGKPTHKITAYAESFDGIHWIKPDLGLIEYDGSKHNNICINDPDVCNACVFRDDKPGVPDDQRYKAVGRWSGGKPGRLYAMTSPDGIHWTKIEEPLFIAPDKDPQFDTYGSAFWDARQKKYFVYNRGWFPEGDETGWWREKHRPNKNRIRAIRMSMSDDFKHWTEWRYIDIGEKPWQEHLYTNSAHIYYRAPLFLAFPKRFVPKRKFFPDWKHKGQSDVLFLTSRDGVHWSKYFRQAFFRPGLDPKNWHERAVYVAREVVPTAPGEMSLYIMENYRMDSNHVRRYTMREDGFVSVNGTWPAGMMLTKPVTFTGDRLEINYSTSAAGYIKIELCDAKGKVIPGYEMDDDHIIFGDEISRIVQWRNGADVSSLQGKPVRLRVEMLDADLYSFRFTKKQ